MREGMKEAHSFYSPHDTTTGKLPAGKGQLTNNKCEAIVEQN